MAECLDGVRNALQDRLVRFGGRVGIDPQGRDLLFEGPFLVTLPEIDVAQVLAQPKEIRILEIL